MNKANAMPAIIKGAYGFDREVVIVTGAARVSARASQVCLRRQAQW
jgi:hypothetical protein